VQSESLYLDYNATSPLSQSVTDWLKSGGGIFANPASQHSAGKAARKSINETRNFLFHTFGLSEVSSKLFFHSGATEGLVSIAYSFSEWTRKEKKPLLICYAASDHPAVTSLAERRWGEQVRTLLLEQDANLNYLHQSNLKRIQEIKAQEPNLIILYHHLWVHNETGRVAPLEDLSIFKSVPDLWIHVDAVQAPGKVQGWQSLSQGDIWTFSGHKFGALKGVGFSFYSQKLPYFPLISGGGQQQGLRSGTENVSGIQSIKLALQDLQQVSSERNQQQRDKLLQFMQAELQGHGEVVNGRFQCSNTIYFFLYKLTSDLALALFDLNGLMLSAGSACSSGAAKESYVLLKLGRTQYARNGLRLSLPFQVSESELESIKTRFSIVMNKIRGQATQT
jgi:cysteine desulfurase